VIITLGTNDMNIYDWDHHDQFAGDYAAMIDDFRALASHPDVYVGPTALGPNRHTPGVSNGGSYEQLHHSSDPKCRGDQGTPIIDFHALLKDHTEYYHDEIHPNDAGYAAMAAAVRERSSELKRDRS